MNEKVDHIRDKFIEVIEFPQWQIMLKGNVIQKIQNRIIVKRDEAILEKLIKQGLEYNPISFDDLLVTLIKKEGNVCLD